MSDTYVWTGNGDGIYWFTAANWFDVTTNTTAASAPGAGATVDFNASASDVSGGADVAAVNIAPGAQVSLGTLPGGATYQFGTLTVGNAASLTLLGGTSMAVGTAELGPSAGLDISRAWYLGVSTHDLNAAADAATTSGTGAYPGPVGATIDELSMQPGAAVTLGANNLGVGVLNDANSRTGNQSSLPAGFTGTGHLVEPTRSGVSISTRLMPISETLVGGGILDIPCFVAGTRVATDAGEARVESLRPGDRVLTASGRLAPVRWVGLRGMAVATPVRLAAGAIAPGVPRRDLLLSPDHAVFLDGALIPAHRLCNGASVRTEPGTRRVTYVHVELDRHDLLLAEGLASESYLDTGNRVQFDRTWGTCGGITATDAGGERVADALAIYARAGCAELLLGGERLRLAHRRLLARARALGWRLGPEAAPRLLAGGRALAGRREADGTLVFTLPSGTEDAVLVSRSFVPSELDPARPDGRRLGVAAALMLDGAAAEEATFGPGWYAPDPGCAWRWTDGAAQVLLGAPARPVCLGLRLLPSGARYWRVPASDRAAA